MMSNREADAKFEAELASAMDEDPEAFGLAAERQLLPDQEARDATGVACPVCQAPKGVRCRTLGAGLLCSEPHTLRGDRLELGRLKAENEMLRDVVDRIEDMCHNTLLRDSPWYEKALFHALSSLWHGDDSADALAKIETVLEDRPGESGALPSREQGQSE